MKYDYVFWDFNGTILDDVKLCYDILIEMLKEEKRPIVSLEAYLMIFDFPVESYYAKVYDLKKTSYKELAHRFIRKYQPRSLEINLHENVEKVIGILNDLGVKQVLLSASEEKNLMAQLKHFQIDHLFIKVLGTSNVYAKSKLDVARDYVREKGIHPSQVLMIGDTLHDAEVAHNLGFDVVLFSKGHQHRKRLENYQVIDDLLELINIVKAPNETVC